ncbi:MAG: SET domain-containing protein-lysine N-methyltransferase [Pseudomonadota bacterium]
MKVYIKSSLQHGKGVFAQAPILAGEIILTFSGPLLIRVEVCEEDYHLQVGADLYLGASGAADDYVNHSCNPNAGFRDGLVLVARRNIGPEEEITWDYSTAIDEEDFPGFTCCCGAAACRGAVRSFRHLDPDTRERLRGWLLPYLREKYFP